MPTPQEIREKLEAGVERAATVQTYRLTDGTSVSRAPIKDAMDARRELLAEENVASRGGFYRRIGFLG